MSVVVADLVAKIRADTSELQSGVQQGVQTAKRELQGIEQQASQASRALEIMAAQFAKLHGGTAADALTMFQKAGVQPTSAAMAEAAKAAQSTAAAVQQVVVPTQAAARAAEDVGKGWTAAESNVVRFGAGILGVGLGISLVAGAARLIHAAISDVVNSQLEWERSLVSVRALYGAIGPQVLATAQAQAFAPGLAGTAQDFTQAALNARYLSSRYGLPQTDINTLTSAAGRAAGTLNLDPAAMQATFLQAIESGGPGLRTITGTELDPLSVARRLGGASAAQIQALTPAQLSEVRLQAAAQDTARLAISGAEGRPGLLEAQTKAQKALTEAQTTLQNRLEGLGNTTPGFEERGGGFGSGPGFQVFSTPREIGAPARIGFEGAPPPDRALTDAVQAAQKAFEEATKAVGDNQKALDDATVALAKLGVETGTATFRLLGFTGSFEDPRSIARLDLAAQAQSAVASRAVGPNPIQYQSPAEIAAQATERASQDALKAFIAPTAQESQQQNQAIRQRFEQQAGEQGPGLEDSRAAGQAALSDLNRRQAAETARLNAQQAGALAQRAQAEAQAQLSEITIQQDERRLAVAEQLAGYRTQALQLEGQMAPLLLQQASLQDRVAVAARDNLQSRRELIAAEQEQLQSTQITSAYDYEQERLKLRAQQSLGSILSGQGPTEDFGQLQQEYFARQVERASSGVDIQALDARRRTEVVGQQRQGEQLARDDTLTNLEAEGRALDDQSRPLAAILRETLAREASLQRSLALLDLQDTKATAAAQHALNAASQLALRAAEAERAAADLAANMDLGGTAADRFASAMSRGYAAINDSAVSLASVHDMLLNMPPLVVPTQAAAPANGGSRVPGAEFAIPSEFIPFPKYDPNRAFDQFPGMPPGAARSTELHPTHEDAADTRSLATPTAPPTAQPGGAINIPFNFTVAGQTPQQIKDQVHQAVEDALNNFFSGATAAGTPAPGSVAGAGR